MHLTYLGLDLTEVLEDITVEMHWLGWIGQVGQEPQTVQAC